MGLADGMTDKQVLQSLRHCHSDSVCNGCPAFDQCDMDADWIIELAAERLENRMNITGAG